MFNLSIVSFSFEFEWGFHAQSASEAIFRARTYNHITYSVRWWWNQEDTDHRETNTNTANPIIIWAGLKLYYLGSHIVTSIWIHIIVTIIELMNTFFKEAFNIGAKTSSRVLVMSVAVCAATWGAML